MGRRSVGDIAADREAAVIRITANPLVREAEWGEVMLLAFADRQRYRQRDPRVVCMARHAHGGVTLQYGTPVRTARNILRPVEPLEQAQINAALNATFHALADGLQDADPPLLTLLPSTLSAGAGAKVRFVHAGVVFLVCITSERVTAELTRTSLSTYGHERCEAARTALMVTLQSAMGQGYVDAVRAAQRWIALPACPDYAAAQGM